MLKYAEKWAVQKLHMLLLKGILLFLSGNSRVKFSRHPVANCCLISTVNLTELKNDTSGKNVNIDQT